MFRNFCQFFKNSIILHKETFHLNEFSLSEEIFYKLLTDFINKKQILNRKNVQFVELCVDDSKENKKIKYSFSFSNKYDDLYFINCYREAYVYVFALEKDGNKNYKLRIIQKDKECEIHGEKCYEDFLKKSIHFLDKKNKDE